MRMDAITPTFDRQPKAAQGGLTDCPSISVVIAVRDDERTIQRAILGALNQSSPVNEVIVVDDMSLDGTRQRVLELMSDRVVVVDGRGQGAAAARNVGIRLAAGAWIAFLDGDDYWEPEFLELARLRISLSPGAVLCFGAATPIDETGRMVGCGEMPEVVTLGDIVSRRISHSTSATLVRRDAVNECGGFFEGFRRAVEDIDLWLRLATVGPCIGFPQAASLYEVHDERDCARSVDVLTDIQHDYEMMVERFAATGASSLLVRKSRAVAHAHVARYWLQAEQTTHARAIAQASMRTLPTRDGFVAFVLASMPRTFRAAMVRLMRRYRTHRLRREA